METVRHPLDHRPPPSVQGKSPHVQVEEPYGSSKWLLLGLYPETRICRE